MSMFDAVTRSGTNGANHGISTADIVETLERWESVHGIDIIDVGRNRLLLAFRSLPEDLTRLAEEIYGICPDVMAPHAGSMGETLSVLEQDGWGGFANCVEFEEKLGLELLEAALREKQAVALLWH